LSESRAIPQNLSLLELLGEISRARLFIGNDSGLTHLAAYIGCPTIALFGPTDPRIWGPIGRRVRVIWKAKLEDIAVDEVLLTAHESHTRT
jgi:ADP-heptose:LPS heptosyltransferase